MTVRNLHWELETTFTRKQVIAMAKVAGFVGNIEAELKKGFPTSCKDIDWESFREAMTLFAELGRLLGSLDSLRTTEICGSFAER